MASEDGSGVRESRDDEQTGPFTFQTGTLCGLYPLLLPSGSYPPLHPLQSENPRRDPSKDFPATVTQKSLSCRPDAHLKSGRSSWNSPALGPETLVSRERGAQSATNEEISWDQSDPPLFLEDWKFQQEMQMYRQEVASILREIQEDLAKIIARNVLPGMASEHISYMASEDGSGVRESRDDEQTGPFTFQTGTLCGLYPLLLPSGSYPPLHPLQPKNPRRDPSKDFPATVTQKSLSCRPDAHLKSRRSSWNSPALGRETLVSRERGAQSATNEEISWDQSDPPLFLEDWKFQQEMQMYRQEVASILREIQEDLAKIIARNVLPGMASEHISYMASEDGSGVRESRDDEQTGPFTFQTGTLCGLSPLLLPSGSYPPLHPLQPKNPRRDPSKGFPATGTQKSLSCRPDAHLKSGRSSWNSPALGPETLVSRVRGAQSATNEEISLFLEDWKFKQEMQMYRQEVANILREIQEDVAKIIVTNMLPGMAREHCAPKVCPPKSSLPTRRRLTFDT